MDLNGVLPPDFLTFLSKLGINLGSQQAAPQAPPAPAAAQAGTGQQPGSTPPANPVPQAPQPQQQQPMENVNVTAQKPQTFGFGIQTQQQPVQQQSGGRFAPLLPLPNLPVSKGFDVMDTLGSLFGKGG